MDSAETNPRAADERVHGVSDADRELVVRLIESLLPNARIIAFGSRLAGRGRRYSDLDIAIDIGTPIPFERMAQLRERFAESRLVYLVDFSDFQSLSAQFRELVVSTGQVWR